MFCVVHCATAGYARASPAETRRVRRVFFIDEISFELAWKRVLFEAESVEERSLARCGGVVVEVDRRRGGDPSGHVCKPGQQIARALDDVGFFSGTGPLHFD